MRTANSYLFGVQKNYPMNFFDFLSGLPAYSNNAASVKRMNKRHAMLIEPFRDRIHGKRVLDLGAHDGRWSFALAAAGAREVVGVEARQELIDRFDAFPSTPFKKKVLLKKADLHEYLDTATADQERFETVVLFGIFYHIMDHFRVLRQTRDLGATTILIDSEFIKGKNPMIQLVMEKTALDINAAPQIPGQEMAVKGVPSFVALDRMAGALGMSVEWVDAGSLYADAQDGVRDYFRETRMIRAMCALTVERGIKRDTK